MSRKLTTVRTSENIEPVFCPSTTHLTVGELDEKLVGTFWKCGKPEEANSLPLHLRLFFITGMPENEVYFKLDSVEYVGKSWAKEDRSLMHWGVYLSTNDRKIMYLTLQELVRLSNGGQFLQVVDKGELGLVALRFL